MSEAKKERGGKPDLSLIPYCVETELARAMMYGEGKYGRFNYCKGHKISELVAAAKRHLGAFLAGEDCAADSGVHHLAHAMANCLMMLHQRELGTLTDDRYQPAPKNVITSTTVFQVVVRGTRLKTKKVLGTYPSRVTAETMAREFFPNHWPADSFAISVEEVSGD